MNEIKMMKRVAEGGNPHVVSLIGCVTRDDPLCLVIEYLKYGDLKSYLHSIKEQVKTYIMDFIRCTILYHSIAGHEEVCKKITSHRNNLH